MKKFLLFAIALVSVIAIEAQTYCASSAVGYGAAATGGGNATPTLVSSVSQLENALKASGSKVIIITQNLTFTKVLDVKATNKTLMALPGVTLTSNKQDATNSGILYFQSGSSNIILRNLTFIGPGAYDCDGWDLLCFDGVTKAWVDHCDFQDGVDGNFDNKGKTDNVTVSWCRFRYLKAPRAGGSGGSDDHRYSNLLGSSSSDKPSDGTYNMTWAYCWWDNGCRERMLRCRNASLHFLNCYWNSSEANYYVGPENADCYFEGCSMQGKVTQAKYFYQNYGGTNGSKWVNCIAKNGVPANVTNRTVATIPYTYTALSASDAVTAITNATCGAGATLNVTTAGVVSSSCDTNGNDNGNQSQGGSETCLNLLAAPELSNGMSLTVNGETPTYDAANGIRLATNTDYFCVDVSGLNTTILSAVVTLKTGSTADTKGIYYGSECAAEFASNNSIVNTGTDWGDYSLNAINSTVLSIRRRGTSTDIKRICLTLADEISTGVENEVCNVHSVKCIEDGQIVIVRGGVRYDITGRKIK